MNLDEKVLHKILASNLIALFKIHQDHMGFIIEMQGCVSIKTKIPCFPLR